MYYTERKPKDKKKNGVGLETKQEFCLILRCVGVRHQLANQLLEYVGCKQLCSVVRLSPADKKKTFSRFFLMYTLVQEVIVVELRWF